MQGPGANHIEIGDQCPHMGEMLHPAHQVLISGVFFKNHRRPFGFAVLHQHIDLVPPQGRILRLGAGAGRLRARRRSLLFAAFLLSFFLKEKMSNIFNDVLFHRLQVFLYRLHIVIFLFQFVDHRADGEPGDFLVEFTAFFPQIPFPLRNLLKDLLGLLLKLIGLFFDLLTLFIREFFEFVRRQRLPFLYRRKH